MRFLLVVAYLVRYSGPSPKARDRQAIVCMTARCPESLRRHLGQLELRHGATGFQQGLEAAENDRPATATALDVFLAEALGVEFLDREPHDLAESVDLERDDGSGQMAQFLHPLDVPRHGQRHELDDLAFSVSACGGRGLHWGVGGCMVWPFTPYRSLRPCMSQPGFLSADTRRTCLIGRMYAQPLVHGTVARCCEGAINLLNYNGTPSLW